MSIERPWDHGRLEVSENGHFFQHEDGTPFFWQADTCWLLFTRATLAEADAYFADRSRKGFNVVQVMVLHSLDATTRAGRSALIDRDVTRPDLRGDDDGEESASFWEHVDAVVELAKTWGIYLALVPLWGTNVKDRQLTTEDVAAYGAWLARRYRAHPNIVWLNGGDIHGSTRLPLWRDLGTALRKQDPGHLITFHPFGRCQSSTWFHDEHWLDFNMIQSGHRDYEQVWDDDPASWKGPDSWRYVEQDFQRYPAKPTVDGEPCYEDLPRGLHDPVHGYWQREDARRFCYWAVFAGAAGHTYGQNAVIQTLGPGDRAGYGATMTWFEGIEAPGSGDVQHLKNLLLSYPYLDRIPDQTVIVGDPGFQKDRVLVTRGRDYLFGYRFTGRPYELRAGVLEGDELRLRWMDPATGEMTAGVTIENSGILSIEPPVGRGGNTDVVLVLETVRP